MSKELKGKKLVVGFDIDGVLCEETYESFKNEKNPLESYLKAAPDFTPTKHLQLMLDFLFCTPNEVRIITFRHISWKEQTEKWFSKFTSLDRLHFHYATQLFIGDDGKTDEERYRQHLVAAAKHKIQVVKDHRVSLFFEDTKYIVEAAQRECSECVRVLVNKMGV